MIKILLKATASLFLVLTFICCSTIQPAYYNTANAQPETIQQPSGPVTVQTFYDELQPYGQWIEDPDYGYVWIPDAGPEFKPYATNGHWVATEYGNTWVSDYDWGWAAFHYGRWRFADNYGWEWIPGTEWAPAWVNWRTGGDYYGWAPLGPGIDINVSLGSGFYAPDNYWVFAPRRYVYEPNIYRYCVPHGRNVNIIRNTTIINNVYSNNNRRYIAGPRPDDVRRYTNAPVNIYNINNINRPGGAIIRNHTLNIYRPQIASNHNNNYRPNRVSNGGRNDDNRNRFNNSGGRNNIDPNRDPAYNNSRQPVNPANGSMRGNDPGNTNHPGRNSNNDFGRGGRTGNNNNGANSTAVIGSGGNQFPQRSYPTPNNNNNNNPGSNPGTVQPTPNINGNNPSNQNGRPTGGNNPSATNQNGQHGNDWRQSKDFDRNRPIPNNQQIQQNPVLQQHRSQEQQNQQRQQMQQQRERQNQQRQQKIPPPQQRIPPSQQAPPARQEVPERVRPERI